MADKHSYIKLTEQDFKALISGGQVDKLDTNGHQVHLILEDMGYDRMQTAVTDEIMGSDDGAENH
ncbi:hypothetical protein [Neptuniibacter sp. QD37_11]|uniref:hypothetical protein n=1 Tax=Neptuniibacter sp. QD37_11 TaxID=3398209 RepID=UPI0039F49954